MRVHPEILQGEDLPPEVGEDKDLWKRRFASINDLEKHLYRNGTRVVKFFLHLSKEEQRQRFLRRIEDPADLKFSKFDLAERGFWKEYQAAYEDCLAATSTKHAPWYVVPAG